MSQKSSKSAAKKIGEAIHADRAGLIGRFKQGLAQTSPSVYPQVAEKFVCDYFKLACQAALQLAETLLAQLPPTNQIPGSPVVTGSDSHLRAAITVGLAHAYGDQLADSQEHFEQLLAKIPHNTDIRQELANVYRWRGWIDRSLSEYAQVLAVEPDLVSARVGNTHAQLDNRDYAPVEKELVTLNAQHGQEPAVKDLNDRWLQNNQQALEFDSRFGTSSGPTFGENQYEIDVVWFSKVLAQRYRATVQTHDAFAEFPEGDGRRKRLEAGVEYGFRRWTDTLNAGSVTANSGGAFAALGVSIPSSLSSGDSASVWATGDGGTVGVGTLQITSASLTLRMAEQNSPAQSGSAVLTASGSQTNVVVSVTSGPSGLSQPIHIHSGTCGENLGGVEYGLTALVDGRSESTVDVS